MWHPRYFIILAYFKKIILVNRKDENKKTKTERRINYVINNN